MMLKKKEKEVNKSKQFWMPHQNSTLNGEDNDANLKNKQYFKSKSDENIIKVRILNVLTSTSDNQNKVKIWNHQTRQLR